MAELLGLKTEIEISIFVVHKFIYGGPMITPSEHTKGYKEFFPNITIFPFKFDLVVLPEIDINTINIDFKELLFCKYTLPLSGYDINSLIGVTNPNTIKRDIAHHIDIIANNTSNTSVNIDTSSDDTVIRLSTIIAKLQSELTLVKKNNTELELHNKVLLAKCDNLNSKLSEISHIVDRK